MIRNLSENPAVLTGLKFLEQKSIFDLSSFLMKHNILLEAFSLPDVGIDGNIYVIENQFPFEEINKLIQEKREKSFLEDTLALTNIQIKFPYSRRFHIQIKSSIKINLSIYSDALPKYINYSLDEKNLVDWIKDETIIIVFLFIYVKNLGNPVFYWSHIHKDIFYKQSNKNSWKFDLISENLGNQIISLSTTPDIWDILVKEQYYLLTLEKIEKFFENLKFDQSIKNTLKNVIDEIKGNLRQNTVENVIEAIDEFFEKYINEQSHYLVIEERKRQLLVKLNTHIVNYLIRTFLMIKYDRLKIDDFFKFCDFFISQDDLAKHILSETTQFSEPLFITLLDFYSDVFWENTKKFPGYWDDVGRLKAISSLTKRKGEIILNELEILEEFKNNGNLIFEKTKLQILIKATVKNINQNQTSNLTFPEKKEILLEFYPFNWNLRITFMKKFLDPFKESLLKLGFTETTTKNMLIYIYLNDPLSEKLKQKIIEFLKYYS